MNHSSFQAIAAGDRVRLRKAVSMQRAIVSGCILMGLIWSEASARADGTSVTGGFVLGIGVRHGSATPLVGLEGGVGYGPERANVGVVYRTGEAFGYAELDPWFVV